MSILDNYAEDQVQSDTALSCKVNPAELEWEPIKHPIMMTFDKSLERLRKAGYKRHPSPAEVFSLHCDYIHGTMNNNDAAIMKNMNERSLEWLSLAFERKGDSLVCYTDPENLHWNGIKYVVNGKSLQCTDKRVFDISSIASGWTNLQQLPSEFIHAYYSRDFFDLPKKVREHYLTAGVLIPRSGSILPVKGGNDADQFIILKARTGSSRGVR